MTNSAPVSGGDIAMRTNGISGNEQSIYDRQPDGSRRVPSSNLEIIESNMRSTLILNHHQYQVFPIFLIILKVYHT